MNSIGSIKGYAWETEFFGISADKIQARKRRDLPDAIQNVLSIQSFYNWNPKEPSTPIAQRLYNKVKAWLPPEDASQLELYCAIGSALDLQHGIDGFFRVGTYNVFIDLTVSRHKNKRRDDRHVIKVRKMDDMERQIALIARKIMSNLRSQVRFPMKATDSPAVTV